RCRGFWRRTTQASGAQTSGSRSQGRSGAAWSTRGARRAGPLFRRRKSAGSDSIEFPPETSGSDALESRKVAGSEIQWGQTPLNSDPSNRDKRETNPVVARDKRLADGHLRAAAAIGDRNQWSLTPLNS